MHKQRIRSFLEQYNPQIAATLVTLACITTGALPTTTAINSSVIVASAVIASIPIVLAILTTGESNYIKFANANRKFICYLEHCARCAIVTACLGVITNSYSSTTLQYTWIFLATMLLFSLRRAVILLSGLASDN